MGNEKEEVEEKEEKEEVEEIGEVEEVIENDEKPFTETVRSGGLISRLSSIRHDYENQEQKIRSEFDGEFGGEDHVADPEGWGGISQCPHLNKTLLVANKLMLIVVTELTFCFYELFLSRRILKLLAGSPAATLTVKTKFYPKSGDFHPNSTQS